MAREIRKFVIVQEGLTFELEVTEGAKCLTAREVEDALVVWFLLNPEAPKQIVELTIVEDSFQLKDAIDSYEYVNTMNSEQDGFHLFVQYKKAVLP